jgi:hypothetical protein
MAERTLLDEAGKFYPNAPQETPKAPSAPDPDSMETLWYGPEGVVKKAVYPNQPVVKPAGTPAQGDQKPVEQQTTKPDTAAAVVPQVYDLKIPDGVVVDEPTLKEFHSLAKEDRLSNERLQKYADMHVKAIETMAQRQAMDWHQQLVNDEDFGGDNLDANMAVANKAFATVAERAGVDVKRLSDDLRRAGVANNPALVKMFHHIGKILK